MSLSLPGGQRWSVDGACNNLTDSRANKHISHCGPLSAPWRWAVQAHPARAGSLQSRFPQCWHRAHHKVTLMSAPAAQSQQQAREAARSGGSSTSLLQCVQQRVRGQAGGPMQQWSGPGCMGPLLGTAERCSCSVFRSVIWDNPPSINLLQQGVKCKLSQSSS